VTPEIKSDTYAKMYSLADFYGTHACEALTLQMFRRLAEHCRDSGEFAQAVYIVYTTTPGSDVGVT